MLQASERFNIVVGVISIIGVIFAIYTFFFNSIAPPLRVTVTDTIEASICNGFLIYDPPNDFFKKTISSEQEKTYLENKIECYRNQIQNNKNDAAAYTNLGEANRRLGDLSAARKAHETALQINPKLQEAYIGLAILEQEEGYTTKANENIKNALKQKANSITDFFKSHLLHQQEKLYEAQTLTVLEAEPAK